MSPGAYVIIYPRTASFLENRVQKVIFFFPQLCMEVYSCVIDSFPGLRLRNLSQEIKAIARNLSQEINGLCCELPCLGQQGASHTPTPCSPHMALCSVRTVGKAAAWGA